MFIYEKMVKDKSFLNKTAFKMSLGEMLHNLFTHSGALDMCNSLIMFHQSSRKKIIDTNWLTVWQENNALSLIFNCRLIVKGKRAPYDFTL